MSYFDCYLIPVRTEKLDAYRSFSERIVKVHREYGAIVWWSVCLMPRQRMAHSSMLRGPSPSPSPRRR
jgi:uncharacterized protein YbaA (DUF1428 family)